MSNISSEQEKPDDHPPSAPAGAAAETPPADAALAEHEALVAKAQALLQHGRGGANWFYWVAGLSLVNSAILLSGGNTFFVVGLAVTLIADALARGVGEQAPHMAALATGIAFGFDVVVALLVIGCGWLSGKRILGVFGLGMALYLLDGLIFVLLQDWMSVAFHAFALFSMWVGFKAYRELKALEVALQGTQSGAVAPD